MTSATQVIKSVGPKLVPFFKTLAIYFVVFIPHDQPSILAAILKCLPIVSLIIFVILYGMNLDEEYRWFTRRILTGLVFSCVGDAFLIWPKYFDFGMVSFAVAHVNYIMAFGFSPLVLKIGLSVYAFCTFYVIFLMPGLHGVLVVGVPVYSYILSTMFWRASARLGSKVSWSKLFTALGAFSFVMSDIMIGISYFRFRINHDQVLIMLTYYAAQLGIALSVLDPRNPHEKLQ